MKKGKSILTRCLALVLALVLIVSSANLGAALKVSAASEISVTAGELVAKNYELADWEEALLGSGLLGGSYTYTVPTDDDGLVKIIDNKIVAENSGNWIPVSANVMNGAEILEKDVPIVNGEGTISYTGDAFSVDVKYVLNYEVSAAEQDELLKAGASLKQGLQNVAIAHDANSNLEIVEQALPLLKELRGQVILGNPVGSDFDAAVDAIANEMDANGGELKLRTLNKGYVAGSAFMLANAAAYKKTVASTWTNLDVIANNWIFLSGPVDVYIQSVYSQYYAAWKSFKGIVKSLANSLEPVAKDSWNVLNLTVKAGAELDALLENVGTASTVSYATSLKAAETVLHASRNTQFVIITVQLKVVKDEVGSTELVSGATPGNTMLALPEGASADAIKAEVEKDGIVARTLAAWGEAYSAEHFEVSYSDLPEKLTETTSYTITYAPKNYTVEYDYKTSESLPYGAKFILPIHETPAVNAYDYFVNGKAYLQGEAVTVDGAMKISRAEGKAYRTTSVYAVIADNFGGNDVAKAILTSGALKGDEVINYRAPESEADVEMSLKNDELKVSATYSSDYEGLSWVPYTYSNSVDGVKEFSGNVVEGYTAGQAQVKYILKLTNVETGEVEEALALAETLKAEATKQKAGMDFLYSYYGDVGTLNLIYLNGLLGTLTGGTAEPGDEFDFTPGDGVNGVDDPNDEDNQELVAYFVDIITRVKAENMDGEYLALYNMLTEYKNGGLAYYYKNSEEIRTQVSTLGSYLDGLVADSEKQDALAVLLNALGYSDYVDKISKLGKAMNDTMENLLPTNEDIDTSKSLTNLVKAVTAAGDVDTKAAATPYILSNELTVVNQDFVVLMANIYKDGERIATVSTEEYARGTVLDAGMVTELSAKIDATVNELAEVLPYYTVVDGSDALAAKIGSELDENLVVSVTCDAKQYTVKIEGGEDQIVTINNLEIDLPTHADHPKTVYEYTIKGEVTRAYTHEFTAEDLNTLFADGSYTIQRTEVPLASQMLDGALKKLNNNTAGNTYEIVDGVLIANIAGTSDGLMAFAEGLLGTGYSHIEINDRAMVYSTENESLEISLQALIDAMVEDTEFGRDTLIALGNNNGGKVMNAILNLGIDADTFYTEDMPFELHLTSVPERMATVAKGLEAGKNHFDFQSNGDHVYVYVNLPEKVYEVYLTGMVGIGELDKTDINAINNAIALNFLYDYVMLIAESDVTAQTFENTLRIFDEAANEVLDKDIPDYDIEAYDKYLQIVKKALTGGDVVVEADETTMSLSVTSEGKYLLTLAEDLGFDLSKYSIKLGMIKEFKDGEVLSGKVIATLANTAVDFEALIVDVDAGIAGAKEIKNIDNRDEAIDEAIDLVKGLGLANGIDYTDNLADRAAKLTGKAAIMLLDDASGNLTFNDTTIIDLNGKTFTGNIVANGHVYIMDSTLDTANAGGVIGSISGNVTIVAGNYTADVSAYLPDGYVQENGTVKNALYTIESPNSGDLIVTVNTDVYKEECVDGYLPSVRALAADIAVDLVFNYYMAAKLSVDTNTIYNIDFDDLVGFVDSNTKSADLINQVLTMVDAEGISGFINAVSADLLDFAAIEEAINNGTEIVSYDLTVAPYGVEIEHITDGDYLTVNLGSVESCSETFKVALMLEGDNEAVLAKVVGELADIVIAENTYAMIDLEQPSYSDRTLWLSGSGKASLDLDLSKDSDYQTIIAVILAYGNPDKAEALVNAIGDQDELKEVFNDITVEEVFNALKALEREVGFTTMAQSLGVEIEVEGADAKERVVHLAFAALGYILEKLEINGYPDKTMGMLEEGDSGRYTLTRDAGVHGDITRRGFTVDASAVVEHVTLSVKIFGDDCLWGDANHDGLVNGDDATLILMYELGIAPADFCTKRTDVNGDGAINGDDATMVLQHELGIITQFPAEKN